MVISRIILTVVILTSTIALYLLPRYVVSNEPINVAAEATTNPESSAPMPSTHSAQIPDTLLLKLETFYESFINAENQQKRFIFADSLAKAYKSVGKLDSLAKYIEVRALEIPGTENMLKAGDAYYEAFNFAVDQSKRNQLAEKARSYYQRILEEDPSLLDVKSKLAMTYVASPQPMSGIMMLREVLEEDPDNELAIYNLGMLAITSGQLDKAIERFEKLRVLDKDNPEANFYLGYCHFEMGEPQKAKSYFQEVIDLGISGDLVLASEEYLERINN
jgi:tetratricopeptide (TPR) repeat protein